MQYRDYYQTLGVERSAPQEEIKKAYRRLSKEFHPDRNQDPKAEDRFKEIGEAYQVLGDVDARRKFDALGNAWNQGQDFRPPGNWEGVHFDFGGQQQRGGPGGVSGFSDFFEMLFGQNAARARQGENPFAQGGNPRGRDGPDREADINVTLEDSYFGGTRQITLATTTTAPHGGRSTERKQYEVKIPKGITTGKRIRLKGEGSEGLGTGKKGDLLLRVTLAPHPDFKVDGHDLLATLSVTPWEAALGAKVPFRTLDGEIKLTIPKNSQTGRRLRLKGKGLVRSKDDAGDLHIELRIFTPPAKTEAIEKLYRKLEKETKFDPRADDADADADAD